MNQRLLCRFARLCALLALTCTIASASAPTKHASSTTAASSVANTNPAAQAAAPLTQAGPATSPQPAAAGAAQPATDVAHGPSAHATALHAAAPLTLDQQIARLPPLTGTSIDVKAQSDAMLKHLNEILRFYREASTRIQKSGEPSDVLYAEQAKSQATQIAQLAFQSARNEAGLLKRVNPPAGPAAADESSTTAQAASQRLSAARARVQSQIAQLQQVDAVNDAAIAKSTAKTRGPLLEKQEQIDGEFKLLQATLDALNRLANFSGTQAGHSGLLGDIERLANSAPELNAGTGKSITTPLPTNVADAQHAGLVTQASVLFDLLSARRSIDDQVGETDRLRAQANDLRAPFASLLRSTMQQGQTLLQQTISSPAPPTSDQQDILATRKRFDDLTATFRILSDAMLPLSQEVFVLEAQRGTLTSWRVAVDSEYKTILRSLLLRLGVIALALAVLTALSTLWSRTTVRYVSDLRRRRQLLVIRRVVVGFAGGLIVIFGFVTQFSSLATFAGFITAGLAVGLQSILLSIAAYFFIIGRYGVRVGDRITVAGVTGTVIEVGLARFYMMELVGSGTELHSTGRVAVFANSVLFQTGTPLYKQLPGTEYAWHELTAKLKPEADAQAVKTALNDAVSRVYENYRTGIEAQQRQIQTWIGAAVDTPRVEAHLRLVDDAVQIAVLFPVEIDNAAQTDAQIAQSIVHAMQAEGPLKQGLVGLPSIKAAIKT